MANHSLPHHLAGGCSEDDDYSASSSATTVSFPSFWPPFPSFLSDSDAPPRHTDRCVVAAQQQQETAAAFLGLGFPEEEEDDDEEGGVQWAPPDLPLCWDCLQLEEEHEVQGHNQAWDGLGLSDADDWEQLAASAEVDAASAAARGLEWEEVLLAANSLGGLVIDDTYLLDDDEDVLFGHLAAAEAEQEPPAKGGRAAAKAAVEGLPTVVVAQADGAVQCAVCKDGIEAGEGARRLPCAHLYHGGCILPWLAIRNTCPLCRHELPTDDADYERWKARPAAGER